MVVGSQSTDVSKFSLDGRHYIKKNIRGDANVMTPNVVAALDNCKISYRNSVHIIAVVADALGHDPQTLILNATSFRRIRAQVRKTLAENIKVLFQQAEIEYVTVHFDGKIVPDTFTGKKIDRFPILVSTGDIQKIIDVPALEDGKGITQANAIYKALKDWGLCDAVQALCCDTTNANLGPKSGAAVILESLLEKDLLYFPCRHHIMEIILSGCFELKFPGTNGPNVPLFKRFQSSWSEINKQNYQDGLLDINVLLRDKVKETVQLIENFLITKMPRDDYRELLELSLKFLGKCSDTTFKKPGACHHARWMAKAIYSLKMYLFRQSFKLTNKEVKGLLEICQFIVFVYLEMWYTASQSIEAPTNDLKTITKLCEYKNVDEKIAVTALNKLRNHLWYLTPECSVMALFNKNLTTPLKEKMLEAMKNNIESDMEPPKKLYVHSLADMEALQYKEIDYFINSHSIKFFQKFKLDTEFLKLDISTWEKNEEFLKSCEKVRLLKVVNDLAERAVHLMQEYISVLTTKEDQKQYLIQICAEFKKAFPNAKKSTIVKKLKTV